MKQNFRILKKNGIYVKETCQVYTCTQIQDDILKNDQVLKVEKMSRAAIRD